jgi:hypothetical protein
MDELEQLSGFRGHVSPPDAARVNKARAALDRAIDQEHTHRPLESILGGFTKGRLPLAVAAAAVACGAAAAVLLPSLLDSTAVAPSVRDSAPVAPSLRDSSDSGSAAASGTERIVYGEGLVAFPQDTASNVVSQADRVVLVTAEAATEIRDNAPSTQAAAGDGLINRNVTFRVDRTLWRPAGAKALTGRFSAVETGWVVHNFRRSRFVLRGSPWIQVGSQYVMPVAFEGGAWQPLMPLAVFPYASEVVSPANTQDTPLAKRLSGTSLEEVAAVFADAASSP